MTDRPTITLELDELRPSVVEELLDTLITLYGHDEPRVRLLKQLWDQGPAPE